MCNLYRIETKYRTGEIVRKYTFGPELVVELWQDAIALVGLDSATVSMQRYNGKRWKSLETAFIRWRGDYEDETALDDL